MLRLWGLGRLGHVEILPAVKFLTHPLDVITQARVIDHTENRKVNRVGQE